MDSSTIIADGISRGFIVRNEQGSYTWSPTADFPGSLAFKDVAIKQGWNECASRLDVDISSEFVRGETIEVPLIAANMDSVVNASFCAKLRLLGALGVLHRAWPDPDDYIREAEDTLNLLLSAGLPFERCLVSAAVGVGPSQVDLADRLHEVGVQIIVIDVAHGYGSAVLETALALRKQWAGKSITPPKIVVGNTTNLDMLYRFNDVADAIKVGLSGGLACRTRTTAGCYEPLFSAVLKFKKEARRLGMPIIGDGGLREQADFVKLVGACASSCMAGSLFARCPESAAELIDGKKFYYGMASRVAQERWKGGLKPGTCSEGAEILLPLGEPAVKLLERYAGALRSGITYSGAHDVVTFQERVEFIKV